MWKPIYQPEPWPQFVKKKDIIALPLMEQRRKYLEEQILFENMINTVNTVNTVSPSVASSAAAAGGGGPAPGGGGSTPGFTALDNTNFQTAVNLWFDDQSAAETEYGLIGEWNTTAVTDMGSAFLSRDTFNEDLSAWDVSSVTGMSRMFRYAISFNNGGQSLENWDVSSLYSMDSLFQGTVADGHAFNQPINAWGDHLGGNGTQYLLGSMFAENNSFNQPLDNWASSFNDYYYDYIAVNSMFRSAVVFNQDLSSWTFDSGAGYISKSSFSTNTPSWDPKVGRWPVFP